MFEAVAAAPSDAEILSLGWGIVVAAVSLSAVAGIFVFALLKVSKSEPSAMLTVTLGMLTLTSLILFSLTGSETLGTIGATGIGALAGALANLFDATRASRMKDMRKPEENEPPEEGQ